MSRPFVLRYVFLLPLAALAGCASQHPQHYAGLGASSSSGLFPQRVYGPASQRLYGEGEQIPTGGGKYHVGKPYQIAGKTYYPSERPVVQTGMASWYGSDFHGRRTANGEVFDRRSITAAHPTMPLPSYARVTNLSNQHSMVVRVNDRGPYHGGRVMDVSQRVAEALDFQSAGTARVKVEWIARANLSGGEDSKLLATLRNDGAPAQLAGYETPASTMTASAEEAAPPAPASKVARADKRKNSDDLTRFASREATSTDDAAMAYAPAPRTKARADETVVSSVHRQEASAPSKPTPLDEPSVGAAERGKSAGATSSQAKSPERLVLPPAGIPLPPSRKARGKEARADEAIQGAVY